MDKEVKISQIKTVPNLMTLLRIVLIVPFVFFFINNQLILAAVTIGLSGLTDALDGFFARKFNQITPLGKILDPIADKLTLFAIMVCVTIYTPIIAPVMVVLIVKDVLMLLGGSVLIKKKITPPASKWYGKVGTFVFYISVCLIVFLKAAFNYQNDILSLCLLSVTALIMLFSLVQYAIIFVSLLKENKNK
ncbi:MAG: CDP-alcohol phosphatidyltransferase family protein [Ruminococcus sp.]